MEEARARTASRSLAERRLAWADVCGKVQYEGLADTAAAQDLCRVVFATVRDYHDKPSQRAVERAIVAALAHADFLKAFAGLVVKAGDKAGELGRSQRLVLTRWSCLLVDALDVGEHAGAFARIAQTQGALAAASALASGSETPPPCSAFQQLLRRKGPTLVRAYLAQLGEGSKAMAANAPVAACGLATELLHHSTTTACSSPEVVAEVRSRAMDAYTRVVLGGDAKAKLPPALPSLFHRLVATMSPAEFADGAVAHSCKQLRRSPDAVLAAVASMLTHAPCANLDAHAGEEAMRDCVLAQVRHVDERRRAVAVGCVAAIANAGAAVAARKYFDAIVAELGDPKRRPKEWQARAGLFAALGAIAGLARRAGGDSNDDDGGDGSDDSFVGSMAREACAALASSLGSEAQRDVKERITDALGAWLTHLPGTLPINVADALKGGIKDGKDGHGKHCLRVLVSAIAANGGLAGGAGSLVKAVAAAAKAGAAKPSQRAEGAMSLFIVASASAVDDDAERDATKEGVWTDAITPNASYFDPKAVAKLGADDSEVLALCLAALLRHHGAHLTRAESKVQAQRTLGLLLLHPASAVRAAARLAATSSIEHGEDPAGLLDALRHWMAAAETPGGFPALSVTEGGGGGDAWSVNFAAARCGEFPSRLAGAALAAFCGFPGRTSDEFRCPAVPSSIAGLLLLTAHHPLCAAPDGRRAGAWEALMARLDAAAEKAMGPDPRDALANAAKEICAVVAGEKGLRSELKSDREAAVRAAFAVARLNPAVALDALLPVAKDLCDVAEHDAIGPNEIKIFNTRIGRLSTDPVDVFKAEVRVNANGPRKARGKSRVDYGSDSDDDAPVAVSLRPSQMAGGKKKGPGGGGAPKEMTKEEIARQAQMKEEAAVREGVRALVDRLTLRLRLTASLMRGGTRRGAAAARVPEIAAEVLPLLDSPILPLGPGQDCAAAMVVAAAGVPGNAAMGLGFGGVPETFAAALRLSAAFADGSAPAPPLDSRGEPVAPSSTRVVAEAATLRRALEAAAEAVEMNDEEPLPAAALALVFPVCAKALLLPDSAPAAVRKLALDVLAPHAAPGVEGLPRAPAAALALTVLEHGAPQLAAAARPLLFEVAAGAGDDEDGGDAVAATLLRGVESQFRAVRAAALAALLAAPPAASSDAQRTLFLARHDPDDDNRATAEQVWTAYGLAQSKEAGSSGGSKVPPADLLRYLTHEAAAVRDAAVGAFAEAVAESEQGVAPALAKLFAAFSQNSPKEEEEEMDADDPFAAMDRKRRLATFPGEEASTRSAGDPQARAAIMRALGAVAPSLTPRDLPLVSTFLTKVLGDDDELVRDAAMTAGRNMIELHGAEQVQQLLPVYEKYFDKQAAGGGGGAEDESKSDNVRQGVVVFLGALACHLDAADPKIRQILARLVSVLSTPSEAVQRSVSDCLPPLMKALTDDERRALVESLLAQVTDGEGYADRRGAAFGLAGAVKGCGISSLKAYGIMDAVKAAVEDKKNPDAREGALMAFELLNLRLGRLFEPYVIHVLPMLLVCFGDQSEHVREATISAARAVMGQLSAQGVKLVLPALMKGLEDNAWRTKQGSVQLMGAMAACAPKQLGACLPQIVPRLSETLIDTHPKVVEAAQHALKAIGDVIKNPEIEALSEYLLGAIAKPAELTQPCLDVLLEMTFVNVVDAPSLALIVPVLSRGLRDRRADLKKKAAKIAGNMCALVADPKDMSPYVPLLLPDIRKSLIDPIPEVRATAASALASLIRGMGGVDEHFADLIPWLTQTLQSDGPMTERSGAAQGLAECLAVLGQEHFEAMLPEILAGCHHVAPHVREGHLTLLRFLPLALGHLFEPHLQEALAEVLTGLADQVEAVRDAALSAGRVFVEEFSHSGPSLDLLLPSIEDGISSENWRIRQSATELMGSMMFRIAGTSGKVLNLEGGSDDEGISTEAQGRALTQTLGEQRHHDLLAAVYSLRSDPTLAVRNAAVHIWKTVVANTPRTLRLVLPHLMRRLIAGLSAADDDRRQTASRCLGELVRKLGERVLGEVFPIFSDGLANSEAATREGVCLGLAEVLAAARKEDLEQYIGDVVPVIRDALCDEEEGVRNAAGAAFDAVFRHGGADVAADIVPALLSKLETDDVALEGLKQVLRAQPKILASVLPKLAAPPIDATRAATLGSLAEVAGPALPPHLEALFPPLLAAMGSEDPDESEAATGAASAVLRAVPDEAHYLLLPEVLGGLEDESPGVRCAAAKLCGVFAAEAPCFDEEDDVPQLVKGLFELFIDDDESVVSAAWTALGVVMGVVAKEDQAHYLRDVRGAVETAREKVRRRNRGAGVKDLLIPALCLPKGLAPIVQVYLQGVLVGKNSEVRESAAEGLREAVMSTTTAALKPHVIPITGPLIRILGDKYPAAVKSAILGALAVMIDKGGPALKPFVPQLQTTFVKCLSDANRPVRQRAAAALGRLMTLQPRVDPLVGDLVTALAAASDAGVREAMLRAIAGVFAHAGKGVQIPTAERARDEIFAAGTGDAAGDGERDAAALALAHVAAWLPDDTRASLIDRLAHELSPDAGPGGLDARGREARAIALAASARTRPELILATHASVTLNGLVRAAKDEACVSSRVAAARGLASIARASALQNGASCPYLPKLLPVLGRLLRDESVDVRVATAGATHALCVSSRDAVGAHLGAFVPQLADVAVGDRSKDARYYADRAIRSVLRIMDAPDGLTFAQSVLKAGGCASAARGKLTDVVLRRLQGLPDEEEDEASKAAMGSLGADEEDDDEVVLGD